MKGAFLNCVCVECSAPHVESSTGIFLDLSLPSVAMSKVPVGRRKEKASQKHRKKRRGSKEWRQEGARTLGRGSCFNLVAWFEGSL